jgi:hypothetical protein
LRLDISKCYGSFPNLGDIDRFRWNKPVRLPDRVPLATGFLATLRASANSLAKDLVPVVAAEPGRLAAMPLVARELPAKPDLKAS